MGKDTSFRKQTSRHDPLGKQMTDSSNKHLQKRNRVGKGVEKKSRNVENESEYIDEEENVISKQLSKKILSQIRQQAMEVEEEERQASATSGMSFSGEGEEERVATKPLLSFEDIDYNPDEDDFDDSRSTHGGVGGFDDDGSDTESRYEGYEDEEEMDEEDARVLEMFMGGNPGEGGVGQKNGVRFTLGELIEAKMKEQERIDQVMADKQSAFNSINPKVLEVYTKVGTLLSRYRSGKVPRALRILPNFENWEDLLYLTRPDKWTPHAVREVTTLFTMGTNARQTQRFLSIILLPRVRDNIAEYKKLNFHLYMALKKTIYRPQAFFKGIILPMAEGGDCTLLEAKIIASVLRKMTIPVLHSAVAMMKLAQTTHYNAATSLFLRTLCDKKYALPLRVVDAIHQHFMSFIDDTRTLPVLWHQSLLVFVQRYKEDIKPSQKEQLKSLLRRQTHHKITSEVRRELFGHQPTVNNIHAQQKEDTAMSN